MQGAEGRPVGGWAQPAADDRRAGPRPGGYPTAQYPTGEGGGGMGVLEGAADYFSGGGVRREGGGMAGWHQQQVEMGTHPPGLGGAGQGVHGGI